MLAVITKNVTVEADLANGSLGTIEKIYVDEREGYIRPDEKEITLKYPPSVVLFKPAHCSFPQLPGLPPSIIPIQLSQMKCKVLIANTAVNVTRIQYPIQPAFAITDYRAQGQTLKPVIVDIMNPPTGGINQFNAYVALSRGVGREFTRILRPFDDGLFTKPVDNHLRKIDAWLQEENNRNKLHTKPKYLDVFIE